MQVIPLKATASQTVKASLAQQDCTITVSQKSTGLFMDLSVAGVVLLSSAICRDRVRIVRASYLGFIGDLAFVDTQGTVDPDYSGLGARWQLIYLEKDDIR